MDIVFLQDAGVQLLSFLPCFLSSPPRCNDYDTPMNINVFYLCHGFLSSCAKSEPSAYCSLWSKIEKNEKKSHLIRPFNPKSKEVSKVSKRSKARERSEQGGASERVSGASKQANRRASGPVLSLYSWLFWTTVPCQEPSTTKRFYLLSLSSVTP